MDFFLTFLETFCNYSNAHCSARCWLINASQSRDIQAKIPSPEAMGFLLVTVKVLNSYELLEKLSPFFSGIYMIFHWKIHFLSL